MPILQNNENETGKISRERTPGTKIRRPHCLDHGSAKIGDKTFGFLIVLNISMQQYSYWKSVLSIMSDWMDTFQMDPKTICASMAIHQSRDMQAFYRMHNVKRHRTGPQTPWPNRAEMCVRLFKKFLLALLDTKSQNLDQTTLAQITPAQLMHKASVRNTQVTSSGQTPMELAMGRRPASLKPKQLTSSQPSRTFSMKRSENWL